MDDNKIRLLLTAVRTGSFNRTAQELNCTQSAVTQMMNSLENELGCRVLQRSHSGVRLTPAGESLLPLFLEADAALTHLAQQARLAADGLAVPLRIGSFSSISNTWLPAAMQDFHGSHPDVSFDIRVGTDAVADWLLNGKIDLALGDADRCRAFRFYPLMDDPYYAVVPAGFTADGPCAITQEELAGYPFIMAPMNALDRHLSVKPEKQLRVNCDDDSTLLSMVAQGLGVTVMPLLSIGKLPENVRRLELLPRTQRVLGVALPNSPDRAAIAFCSFLRKRFAASDTAQ